jgi:hypothetical protein
VRGDSSGALAFKSLLPTAPVMLNVIKVRVEYVVIVELEDINTGIYISSRVSASCAQEKHIPDQKNLL